MLRTESDGQDALGRATGERSRADPGRALVSRQRQASVHAYLLEIQARTAEGSRPAIATGPATRSVVAAPATCNINLTVQPPQGTSFDWLQQCLGAVDECDRAQESLSQVVNWTYYHLGCAWRGYTLVRALTSCFLRASS